MDEYTKGNQENQNSHNFIRNLKDSNCNILMSLIDQNKLKNDNMLLQNNLSILENSNSILKEENT